MQITGEPCFFVLHCFGFLKRRTGIRHLFHGIIHDRDEIRDTGFRSGKESAL